MSNTQRNLSWSLSRRPNSSLVANGFPSFKLDSKDVQRGAIKVIAKSPTEQTFPMQVIDDEGLYTTNFTPTKIGDWTISILYEGNHIEGSPFSVRVYDPGQVKIIGLSNGTVGKTSVFHIDTSEAGEGQVAVRVVNRVGTDDIPVDIETDNFGRNIVSFTPRSGGMYKIHVYFAGLEVTGSPFEMTVFDFSEVTVTGNGLGLVPVNQLASFKVNFGNKITDSNRDALIVKIISSRGVSLPCRITSNMDQSFNVDYMPNEVGDHRVDILYHNQPIIGSPFAVRTYDISKVIVSNIPPSALFGQAITFDIDVDNAGDGDLEIMINEGSVPNTVVSSGDRCYQATFVAKEIKPHIVTLRFNNQMVPGSPWTIDIHSNMSVTGSGLANVPVGKPTTFEVNTGNVQKQVFVKIKAPSGREVKTKCKQKQGISIFEYTPTETGTHEIDVRCDGIARVASSPYYSRAYDASAIKVTPVGVTGSVGSPVDLFVDVNQAGDGQLEIMINQGFVPNTVRLVSKGIYQVTFSPVNSKTHLVQITFNGNPVPEIKVPIIDQSLIKVQGEGLIQAAVNQTSGFRVDAQKAGDADFSVKITSMTSGNELPVSIRGNAVKGYDVEFITREPGNYKADVRYGGVAINGGPFVIKSFDLSKVRVVGIRDGIVGAKSTFTADVSDAGEGNMKISITSNVNGQNIPNQVQPIQGGGRFEVTFTPVSSGPHRANVTFNERHVPGSPFSFQIFDLAKLSIKGTGINSVSCNKPSTLTFLAPGTQHTDFDVTVTAPNGQRIIPRISSNGSDGLMVDFTPTMTGNHSIEVSYCGHPVPSCSYNVQVWDATRVLVSDLQPGQVQKASTFNIDASQAGTGNLEIVITNGNENIPNFVTAEGSGRFRATFTPQSSDQLRISVKFNGESVPGSPFIFDVIDTHKPHPLLDGPLCIPIGKLATVSITRGYQMTPIDCQVIAPSQKVYDAVVVDNGVRSPSDVIYAEFIPREVGTHCIQAFADGVAILGSPFSCQVYDSRKVKVGRLPRCIRGQTFEFEVNASQAGAGQLEVVLKSDDYRLPVKVSDKGQGVFKVSFVPTEARQHCVYVYFSKEVVPGSPFVIDVEDSLSTDFVHVRGRGHLAAHVRVRNEFLVEIGSFVYRPEPVDISIVGPSPSLREIPISVSGNLNTGWTVSWSPPETGTYTVDVKYGGAHVAGSPFKCSVYDLSRITVVRDLSIAGVDKDGIPGEDVVLLVDASEAGPGNLEVIVRNVSDGSRIPNFLEADDLVHGRFRVYFTPRPEFSGFQLDVSFNDDPVSGSPFLYSVIDGKKARATGEGLGKIPSNKPTSFDVICREVGGQIDKLMTVDVFDSNGESVPSQVSRPSSSDFHVTYTPKIIGRYKIQVKYADMEITGSPFYPEVFDPTQIFVSKVPRQGIFAQPVEFEVDTRGAGEGHLTVKVKDHVATYDALIKTKSPGQHSVSFDPRETGPHNICVFFDGQPVPGSPYICSIFDPRNIFAKWDTARIAPVNRPVHINIESKVPLMADVVAKVVDPYGSDVPVQVIVQGSTSRIVEFIPREVGPFRIELSCVGVDLLGSPFTCNAFDASRVHIQNAVRVATVLQPVSFSVDTSEAGVGDVDVEVTYGGIGGGIGGGVAGQNRIAVRRQQSNAFSQLYTFQPTLPIDHLVTVLFNKELVVGSPMLIRVCDVPQSPTMPLLSPTMAVNETFSTANMAANGDLSDARVNVTAPNGELVSAYLVQQPDGEYKIQYSSPFTGKHRVEIVSGGQRIMGSPFNVEIFDANKVRVNGKKSSAIGEKVELDVIHRDAGEAELGVKVVGPRGNSVPFDISKTESGHHIVYSPNSPGTYQVYATYGGQDIPGCPIKYEVYDLVRATAHGEGLTRGIKDQISTFVVDSKGQRGDLVVQVDGPNSIARCNIDPGSNGVYRVSFIPLETGNYNVFVRFNGQEVNGSPFHPKVVDPSKVSAVGGWDTLVDRNNRMRLNPRQTNRLELDTSRAGPGTLTAEIVNAQGSVPVEVSQTDNDRYLITFVPREDGDYIIKAFWNGEMIPRCPITATTASSISIIKPEKVIMTGQGLTLAKVDQRAEFVIDGSAAGPGTPEVRLIGISNDIPVRVTSIGQDIYRCIYKPSISGAYLLKVQWSGQQVVGSPFKVNVVETANASQVICSGEGLRKGILGHEIKCLIDTRNAGPGELAVQCTGPNRSAISELTDHRDGTFTLQLKPLETGRHKLEIKYSGEHVPGSPFTLKVSSPPDASKVKVFGPGIQHGLLVNYHSHFTVDTTGAGAGQLTVRIRGPRGAFCVEMQRDYRKDRLILCRYDPAEIGDYIIHIKWSGTNIPGSPFHVRIFDTQAELEKFVAESAFLDHSNFDVRDYDD